VTKLGRTSIHTAAISIRNGSNSSTPARGSRRNWGETGKTGYGEIERDDDDADDEDEDDDGDGDGDGDGLGLSDICILVLL